MATQRGPRLDCDRRRYSAIGLGPGVVARCVPIYTARQRLVDEGRCAFGAGAGGGRGVRGSTAPASFRSSAASFSVLDPPGLRAFEGAAAEGAAAPGARRIQGDACRDSVAKDRDA